MPGIRTMRSYYGSALAVQVRDGTPASFNFLFSPKILSGKDRSEMGGFFMRFFERRCQRVADWTKIKTEYVTGDISLRKLAEKNGVSYSQIAKKAASENWVSVRRQQRIKIESKTNQKTIEKISDSVSEIAAYKSKCKVMAWKNLADTDLNKLEEQDKRRWYQNYETMIGHEPEEELEETEDSGLMDALNTQADELFDDDDDSSMLPEVDNEAG